jgi:hypothetical protein
VRFVYRRVASIATVLQDLGATWSVRSADGNEVILPVDNMGVNWTNCYGEWDGGDGVGTTQERGGAKNKRATNG